MRSMWRPSFPKNSRICSPQILLDELESERKWDELFSRPESEELLNRMAEETLADYKAGLTETLDLEDL